MPTKLEEQAREIAGICERLGIEYDELADAAAINRETMRKYANGYQPIPEATLRALHMVEELRKLQAHAVQESPENKHVSAAYSHLETATLQKSFSELAARLNHISAIDRKYVFGNLRAMLDELQDRDLKNCDLTPDEAARLAAEVAVRDVQSPGVIYGRKKK